MSEITKIEIGPDVFGDKNDTMNKISSVVFNVGMNCSVFSSYDWLEETKEWVKVYFPDLSWEEFLTMAREYDFWNNFEKKYLNNKDKGL